MNDEIQPESPVEATEASEPEATTAPSRDDCNMGMLCHLLSLFANVLGPLIIWLMKKDESEYVNYHGIQAINFQITMIIVYFLCVPLVFVFIGLAILPIAVLLNMVFSVIAAMAAQKGERYEYPFSFKFLS